MPYDTDDGIPRRTSLDFKLDVKNGGQLMDRFGLPRSVNGGSGTVTGHAGWDGSPTNIDLTTLDGNANVDLHHGQILRAPGAAKWLGIFSLRTLANLLTLHFDDVVGKDLPFQKATGTVQIENGIGRTDDFLMTTSPTRVQMKVNGMVDLPKRTQDLNVCVIPTVGAGTLAIGAAVINPLLSVSARSRRTWRCRNRSRKPSRSITRSPDRGKNRSSSDCMAIGVRLKHPLPPTLRQPFLKSMCYSAVVSALFSSPFCYLKRET